MTPAQPCDSTVTVPAVIHGRTCHYRSTCSSLRERLVPSDHLKFDGSAADGTAYREIAEQRAAAAERLFEQDTIHLTPADVFTRSQRRQCLDCWPQWIGALRNRLGRRVRYRDHGPQLVVLSNMMLDSPHNGERTLLGRMLDELGATCHPLGADRVVRRNWQLFCLPGPWAGWLYDLLDRWPNAATGERRRWSVSAPFGYDHATHGPTLAAMLEDPIGADVPLADAIEDALALVAQLHRSADST